MCRELGWDLGLFFSSTYFWFRKRKAKDVEWIPCTWLRHYSRILMRILDLVISSLFTFLTNVTPLLSSGNSTHPRHAYRRVWKYRILAQRVDEQNSRHTDVTYAVVVPGLFCKSADFESLAPTPLGPLWVELNHKRADDTHGEGTLWGKLYACG